MVSYLPKVLYQLETSAFVLVILSMEEGFRCFGLTPAVFRILLLTHREVQNVLAPATATVCYASVS